MRYYIPVKLSEMILLLCFIKIYEILLNFDVFAYVRVGSSLHLVDIQEKNISWK